MDLFKSMKIAASGLHAQSGRMKIIAENPVIYLMTLHLLISLSLAA